MKTLLAAAALSLLLPLAACQSTPKVDAAPVNSMCVMNPDGKVDPSVTTVHDGKTVAFCCSQCRGKFEKLSDADKDARVAAATK
jgi:hypothetical protein